MLVLRAPFKDAADAWLVSHDGSTINRYTFKEVLALLCDGFSPLAIAHTSPQSDATTPWRTIAYTPKWKNPRFAYWWSSFFWIVAFMLVFFGCLYTSPISL